MEESHDSNKTPKKNNIKDKHCMKSSKNPFFNNVGEWSLHYVGVFFTIPIHPNCHIRPAIDFQGIVAIYGSWDELVW
jgi:hypothetical protein